MATATGSASSSSSAGSNASEGGGELGNRRILGLIGLAIVAVIAVVVITGDRTPADDVVLAADNNRPTGAKALKLMLDELDHNVDVTTAVPGGEADVVVVLQSGLTQVQTRALEEYVDQGGRAVVVGQLRLVADGRAVNVGDFVDADGCDIASLADVSTVQVGFEDDDRNRVREFTVLAGDESCLGRDGRAIVVARPTGDGLVVSVGAGELFTNRSIAEQDNAVLAVGLIAPQLRTNVVILEPDLGDGGVAGGQLGAGGQEVWDLIPDRVWTMFFLVTVAALVFIASRGRRLGRVVTEPLPANIEGSEFVTALGNLREQARRPTESARVLQNQLRQDLARSLGLDPNLDPHTLSQVASVRTPATADELYSALAPRSIETDADLVRLASEITAVSKAVRGGLSPGAALVGAPSSSSDLRF